MLPTLFAVPGSHYQYVDLRELFEMNGIPGRFRDWMRRKVIPLLGSAAIQYDRKDSHGNSRDFCVAKENAISLLALANVISVQDLIDKVVPLPSIPYSRSFTVILPFHGFSTNKMYSPARRQSKSKQLVKSQDYNSWLERAKSHISSKPAWMNDKPLHVNYEFSMAPRSDCDNLIKSFQDLIFQHAWGGNDNAVISHFAKGQVSSSHWCKATIYQ